METPVILPGEQICFVRTVSNITDCFTEAEWDDIKKDHFIHEMGYMSNLSPNYADTIATGLLAKREQADEYGKRAIDARNYVVAAVDSNYEHTSELLHLLRYDAPKMGNDIDWVDNIAVELLDMFGNALGGRVNCLSVAGTEYTEQSLADTLLSYGDFLSINGGGVTFSGGEPMLQADFVCAVADILHSRNMHLAVQTSGYTAPDTFRRVVDKMDYVMMDIKLADSDAHKKYTGVHNDKILANLEYLKCCGKAYTVRVPLIPGITDTEQNLRGISDIIQDSPCELLRYNKLASCIGLAFVYAEGDSTTQLMEQCARVALKLLDNGIPHRTERRYPEMFEYLGWCSWDSMQIRVDHKGLVEKCQEFKTKNIPVKWAIIDDMWAHVTDFYGREYDTFLDMVGIMHASAMHDFEPAPIRFPEGLASVGAHFDNNMINCMGMSSEDMFNRRMSPTPVAPMTSSRSQSQYPPQM